MLDVLNLIFDSSIIHSTIRSSTPILFAALGVALTQQANILNVGVEGIMLFGAFTAITVNYFTGSWFIAVLVSMLVGVVIAIIMSIAHLKYNAEIFAVGMIINMLAIAMTRLLLTKIFNTAGSFTAKEIVQIPQINISFLEKYPLLDSLFNNYSIFEILAIVLVFVLSYILYKTVWGLRLRSVGLKPMVAETAGINSNNIRLQVMLYSGVLGGLSGAYLSTGYSKFFAQNMVNGRGFMGVAAMFFGGGDPIRTWIGCLIFGLMDSVGSRLQAYGVPSQFILSIPYIVTIVVLAASQIIKIRKRKITESSLAE